MEYYMKNTKIISAFPACGKTYCFDRNEDYIILDSDSSKFSWIYPDGLATKYRNPDFPKNYIEHIKENIGKVDYIFVSTHEEVRQALTEAGIDFILVFPKQSLRAEWVGRCFIRGSGEKFCQMIADEWNTWMSQMWDEAICNKRRHYILDSDEYLSDILEDIDKAAY
jgi:hypothetical protein